MSVNKVKLIENESEVKNIKKAIEECFESIVLDNREYSREEVEESIEEMYKAVSDMYKYDEVFEILEETKLIEDILTYLRKEKLVNECRVKSEGELRLFRLKDKEAVFNRNYDAYLINYNKEKSLCIGAVRCVSDTDEYIYI